MKIYRLVGGDGERETFIRSIWCILSNGPLTFRVFGIIYFASRSGVRFFVNNPHISTLDEKQEGWMVVGIESFDKIVVSSLRWVSPCVLFLGYKHFELPRLLSKVHLIYDK